MHELPHQSRARNADDVSTPFHVHVLPHFGGHEKTGDREARFIFKGPSAGALGQSLYFAAWRELVPSQAPHCGNEMSDVPRTSAGNGTDVRSNQRDNHGHLSALPRVPWRADRLSDVSLLAGSAINPYFLGRSRHSSRVTPNVSRLTAAQPSATFAWIWSDWNAGFWCKFPRAFK